MTAAVKLAEIWKGLIDHNHRQSWWADFIEILSTVDTGGFKKKTLNSRYSSVPKCRRGCPLNYNKL